MIAPLSVEVGRPVRFEGYAEDYDVSASTGDRWVHWTFEYTPEVPGTYCLLVRSVNERGGVSPEPDTATFIAFAPEG